MTGRGRRAAAALAAWLTPWGSLLLGQAAGTVGLGVSVVDYDGYLATGAAVLSPALQFDTPNFSFGTQGSWILFESGNQVLQGSAAAGWLTPARGPWRLELAGAVGASKYADEPGTGHLLARTRLHLAGGRSGAWLGGTTGASWGDPIRVPFELVVAGWTVRSRVALVGTLTGTWLAGDRHLDLQGMARWTGNKVEVEARVGARPWVRSAGAIGEARTGAYGEVSALVPLGERIAFQASGGRYLSDPVRRLLGATYIAAGIRWRLFGKQVSTIPAILAPVRRRTDLTPGAVSPARLEIGYDGSPPRLRVRVAGAQSVELRGDFTGWEPVQLTRVGAALWEVRLPVGSGVHRLNIRLNGGSWVVPTGTRVERTEFGDLVGIIVVP